MVKQAAASPVTSERDDDSAEDPAECTQFLRKALRIGVAGDLCGEYGEIRAWMCGGKFRQIAGVVGDGDQRPARLDQGLHDAAADLPGGLEDDDDRMNYPCGGIFTPVSGTVSPGMAVVRRNAMNLMDISV